VRGPCRRARARERDSAGAQFFIWRDAAALAHGQYTVFARVVEGIGVVTLISEAPVDGARKATERSR